MKVLMKDSVETAHTIIPELEEAKITVQPGLKVLAQTNGSAGGMACQNYVLNLQKDATITLPSRLGNRLCKSGHAKALWKK